MPIRTARTRPQPRSIATLSRCHPGRPAIAAVAFFLFFLGDALDPGELGALVEVDQAHALGRAALLADLLHVRADRDPARRDQHDLVLVADQPPAAQLPFPLAGLHPAHPFRAPALAPS